MAGNPSIIVGVDCAASATGIATMLASGHRRFIFRDPAVFWDRELDLDAYGAPFSLAFEGAGPHLTEIWRDFAGGPLISATSEWTVSFRGMSFVGARSSYPTATAPLVRIARTRRSYLESCLFSDTAGWGLELGGLGTGEFFEDCELVGCRFLNCDSGGAGFLGGTGLVVIACSAQLTGDYGFRVQTNADIPGGHAVRFTGCQLHQISGWSMGIALSQVTAANVENCAFYQADMVLSGGTTGCVVERNIIEYGSVVNNGSNNTILANWP